MPIIFIFVMFITSGACGAGFWVLVLVVVLGQGSRLAKALPRGEEA